MKKTIILLAVIMAMFMLPTVCSAVGIDGTISMDTELIDQACKIYSYCYINLKG